MLKIAICDDDRQEHRRLGALLQAYQDTTQVPLLFHSFYNGIDLVESMRSCDYDLILLDIVMPGFSGVQTAQEIRLSNQVIKIVFLSSSPEFVMESYSVGAYSYLLKPVSMEGLIALLHKIHGEIDTQNVESLIVKSREGIIRIPFPNIEYVEVMNKTVSFHLADGSVRDTSASLSDFEPQLLSRVDFLKVHRSFLVNLRTVQTLSAKGITTQTGHTIPVSKMLYGQIKEAYMKYLFVSQPKAPKPPPPPPAPAPSAGSGVESRPGVYRILLVDDEAEQQQYWARALVDNGCMVDLASTMAAALELAASNTYDCIVLDVLLFGQRSYPYCKELRELTSAPVVFLSSLTDSDSQLQGFLSGGTDYITKDTPPSLFWAKITARICLFRTGKVQLFFEPLLLDLASRKVLVDGLELVLTPTEFDLLWLLADHARRVYTPEELYHAIWGAGQWDGGQSVQVHLSRMRRKLEKAYPSHFFIETVWGKGYRFVPKEDAPLGQKESSVATV